jgi:hypothetical protein
MAKSRTVESRRREQLSVTGRDRLTPRLRRRDKERLQGVSGEGGGDVHRRDGPNPSPPARQPDGGCDRWEFNWRVRREDGEVLAVEPGGIHEHVFEGANPFTEALAFAAAQLRKETNGG